MDVRALGLLLVLHWVGLLYVIVACPGHTPMLYTACADPERFARESSTLTTFFLFFYERREDPNTSKGGPSSTRHRDSIKMAFHWRVDDCPTLNISLVAL